MPTHAELADKLLTETADFFKNLGNKNPATAKQMGENASVFEQIAALLLRDPTGKIDDKSHAELAARLLIDAANFFRALGKQNPPLEEQMNLNADVYEDIAGRVQSDPLGIME